MDAQQPHDSGLLPESRAEARAGRRQLHRSPPFRPRLERGGPYAASAEPGAAAARLQAGHRHARDRHDPLRRRRDDGRTRTRRPARRCLHDRDRHQPLHPIRGARLGGPAHQTGRGGNDMSTTTPPVDVDVLRSEIQKTYTEVSTDQDQDFIFPTGRAWAEELGYPEPELSRVPDATVESFAGVANHWPLGRLEPGQTVLDLGCGAGTDLLVAAQMVGAEGRVIGIDMTPAMLDRARQSATAMGIEDIE